MSVLDDLRAMRELLDDEARWTQGVGARDVFGMNVVSYSSSAACWCLMGAASKVDVNRAPGPTVFPQVIDALDNLAGGEVTAWNDAPGRTHADVLALLDRAIEREEQRAEVAA